MKALKWFIGAVALVLLTVVGIGLALPGTWAAHSEITLDASPSEVFAYLDSVEGWASWAPLSAVEGTRSGPARGPGASLRWDDAEWGQGEWVLTESEPDRRVAYEVQVEDGALVTRGQVVLTPTPEGGTLLAWRESGDFGWNPVLAYMALGMERLQGNEMAKGLTALKSLLESTGPASSPLPMGGTSTSF